jgi:C4-dicarboxylate transporter/malic acid transport protein
MNASKTLTPVSAVPASTASTPPRRRVSRALERPGDVFRNLGPNWFASVMGTGIVANAAALLPTHIAGLRAVALGVWVLAAAMLVLLGVATAVHWLRHPEHARRHHHDPAMAPFYGAPPMALLTVGAGALLVGRDIVGLGAAVRIDEILWTLGTIGGLVTTVAIPYLMFTDHDLALKDVYATWLMPVVPPMVSAATGAALIANVPAGQPRLTLLLACYAMFGISLFASLITITLVWGRLMFHGPGPARLIPTLWIVLGPLGQSITAAGLLGKASLGVISTRNAGALDAAGVVYGLPVWGFAIIWLAIAASITVRTAREHLPFSLTWWSFTFPVGTIVTGTSVLAVSSQASFLRYISVALYALLLAAWLTAATRTVRGALSGRLFLAARAPAPSSVSTSGAMQGRPAAETREAA